MFSTRETTAQFKTRFRFTAMLVVVFSLTAVGALLWTQFSSQDELRRQLQEQSEKRAVQVAGVMADQIAAAIDRADFLLLQAREAYAVDATLFRNTIALQIRSFPADALLQVSVAAADGTLTWSTVALAEPLSIRDRDHFKTHLDGQDRLYIGKPVIGRDSKTWSVQFSRPILHAGRFAGVVALSMRPEYFARLLAASETSPGDVMTLVHRDGEFIARSRDLEKVLGRMAPRDRAYFDPKAPEHGVFRAPSAVDPSDKIFGWRRIPATGLIVSAGLDTAATLGPVDRKIGEDLVWTAALALLIVVFGAAIAVLLFQFARQQERLMLSEQRMAALNDVLEEGVRLRTVELEALVKELETLNYAVAHDLKTSLGVMSVNAGMLLHDLGEHLSEDARRVLGAISENAQLAARLLDDLMEHSRLGREALERSPVAMHGLVMEAWRALAGAQADRRVSFEAGELPPCTADRRMLAQLWTNLLSNALKFTKTRSQARIEVGYDAAQAAYFVRDNGIGFDMRHAHKLFNVFERLHREEHFDGTGIGLAIAARIVQRHGGRIWAEAVPGENATFYFTLPPAAGGA